MKKLILLVLLTFQTLAYAHKASDSYLSIQLDNEAFSGRWDLALRDLDFALDLDKNQDNAITWGELKQMFPAIQAYAFSRLTFKKGASECSYQQSDYQIDQHTDGSYLVIFFTGECSGMNSETLSINYRLFAELDPQHRGLLKLSYGNKTTTAVLNPKQAARIFSLSEQNNGINALLDFIQEGIWHIWHGFDHILFLLSLLIPSVMVYGASRWSRVASLKIACWDVFKIVSAFTLAHSITLSPAVLGYFALPSKWVESAIALSVILAALNNLIPIWNRQRTLLAFGFGLIHGFGFASVLTDMALGESSKLVSLLGFNAGVEIGQLILVLLFLPFIYRISRSRFYHFAVIYSGSAVIAGIAALWFVERAFGLSILNG